MHDAPVEDGQITCRCDEHHGNVTILDQVTNVGPALLDLEHNLTIYTVGFQMLACATRAQDAVP